MSYIRYAVHLSESQLSKLRSASKKKEPVTITVDPQVRGNFQLYLTKSQIEKLKKGTPAHIKLSKTQLIKNGGFIFTIPALLAGIGTAAGIATGIAKTINEKNYQSRMESEAKRHNLAMEAKKQSMTASTAGVKQGKGVKKQSMTASVKKGKGPFLIRRLERV